MDVDSEDDQMMQAIALSLGQNVSSLESEVVPAEHIQSADHYMLCLDCCNSAPTALEEYKLLKLK